MQVRKPNPQCPSLTFLTNLGQPVGITDHRTQGGTVSWPGGLPFSNQVAQRLLLDDGKNPFSYNPFRMRQGGIGKLKEQSLLARYTFEILEQLTLDFALARGDG